MNLPAIHPMQAEAVVARKCFKLAIEPTLKHCRQIGSSLAPDVAHDDEHGVLHRRIVDGAPVPNPTIYKNVYICGHDANFAYSRRFVIVSPERCEQNRILEREIMLRIVVYALQTPAFASRPPAAISHTSAHSKKTRAQ